MEIIKYLEGDTEILLPWSTKAGQNIFNTLWIENLVGLAAVSQPDAASVVQGTRRLSYGAGGRGCNGCTASRELGPSEKPEGRERGWKSSSATWQESSGRAGFRQPLPAERCPLLPAAGRGAAGPASQVISTTYPHHRLDSQAPCFSPLASCFRSGRKSFSSQLVAQLSPQWPIK